MNKEESFTQKAEDEQKAIGWYSKKKKEVSITATTEQYECFDNWVMSGNTIFLAEVKVRNEYSSTQIDNYGGAYIEFTKLEGVRRYKERNNDNSKFLYYNFFSDCLRIYQLNTDPTQYKWEMKWLPKDNYDKTKVWKFVATVTNDQLIETIKYNIK